ncbi:MAG: radical SAM protein [Candidatus Hodarchaeota archaeon]
MSDLAQLKPAYYPFIVLKVSSQCNLACKYCHATNLPKKELLMSIELFSRVLSEFIPFFKAQRNRPELQLIFHGGEPLLAGLAFYREVIELESHIDTTDILLINGIQTNGTLITEDWIELFKQGNFRVGISVDGPEALHNKYRMDKCGRPTFNRIAESIEMLQDDNLPFGLLSVVTADTPSYCEKFFHFLIEWDISRINFLPRIDSTTQKNVHAYSKFMRDFFDLWLAYDAPFSVLTFQDILEQLSGKQGRYCYFTEKCRKFIFIDTLGRIFPCDRFMDDERYYIGKISSSSFEMVESAPIGLQKKLPKACSGCKVQHICSGGCPALIDPATGRDFYCSARKALIQHIIRKLQEYDLSPDEILQRFDQRTVQWADTITL